MNFSLVPTVRRSCFVEFGIIHKLGMRTPMKRPLIPTYQKFFLMPKHYSSIPLRKGMVGKIGLSNRGFTIALVIAGFGMYLSLRDKLDERGLTNLGIKHHSRILLNNRFVSKEYLVKELFLAVNEGEFERAKSLIEIGGVSVNATKVGSEKTFVLLEEFCPKSASELDQFIDFAEFVLRHGYSYVNHSVGDADGGCNLLTNIYKRHIFERESKLRRKLVEFFLKIGVNPLAENKYLKTPLLSACSHGDGEFFIKACDRHSISLDSVRENPSTVLRLLMGAMMGGHSKDLIYLLKSFVKISLDEGEIRERLLRAFGESPCFMLGGVRWAIEHAK